MKVRFTILALISLLLGACSTSTYLADDAYYSPKDDARAAKKAAKQQSKTAAVAANQNLEAVQYSEPEGLVTGVANGDTLTLDNFEYENGDKEVVVNNYYENSYADGGASYESRINRFYGPSVGFGYYSPYYSPYASSWGPTLSMSIGFGMGFGFGYGMGSYYNPFYPPSCYPYPYYGGGYYGGGYYGGGYYGGGVPIYDDGNNGYYSSHRKSSSTARALNQDYIRAKSGNFYIPATTVGRSGRRGGGTAVASTKSATTTSAQPAAITGSRRSINTRSTSGIATTRVIPNSKRSSSTTGYRRPGQPVRVNQSVSGKRPPYRSGSTSTATAQNRTQSRKVNTKSTTSSTKRYIPRYSTPKANTKPSYNRSGSSSRVSNSSSSVRRQGYSTPTRSRSTYSAPSRSNYNSSSYNRSSSGSSYRSSSTSVSRPSSSGTSTTRSSSSRSSGSSGRRR